MSIPAFLERRLAIRAAAADPDRVTRERAWLLVGRGAANQRRIVEQGQPEREANSGACLRGAAPPQAVSTASGMVH